MITGVLGAVLGPSLLKVLKITDPVAKGVATSLLVPILNVLLGL